MMLKPNQPFTFSLSPDEVKSFSLIMKEDDFAEVNWLANESLILSFHAYYSSKRNWLETTSVGYAKTGQTVIH